MPNEQQELRSGKVLAFNSIGIGAILLCIPLLFEQIVLGPSQNAPALNPFFHAFLEKLFALIDKTGDACLIAGLLGIVIDEGLKSKFIQDVVQAASPRLIGQHLPEPVRIALLNYFKIDFVRPDWEIEYEIAMVENFPDFVSVTSRIRGVVQNCGTDLEDYTLISSLDPAPPNAPGEALITRVSMRPESSATEGFDENPDNATLVQPDHTKLFQRTLPIPPGGRFNTVLETREYRPTSTVLPLFTGTTVVKSTVRIRYPKNLLDMQVSTGTSMNLKPEPTVWGANWEIPTALLPGQCILATWNPIGTAKGAAKGTAPAAPPPAAIAPKAPAPVIAPKQSQS